jgi:NlpC/P60 family putative phage cell wall peptidase
MAIDTPDLITLARDWIGTPYVHQASLKGVGCDCLGLLRGVFRERFGAEPEDIPPYDPHWDVGGREELREGLARHFCEIAASAIAPGDVLLFRMLPRATARHCAILAEQDGQRTLIHARQNKRVSEEPFTAAWAKKLAFAFRP